MTLAPFKSGCVSRRLGGAWRGGLNPASLALGLRRRSDGRLRPQATSTSLEPMPGNPGVMGGVLGIAMAEVILHGPQIGALICKILTSP
jgi:hypothetical protein